MQTKMKSLALMLTLAIGMPAISHAAPLLADQGEPAAKLARVPQANAWLEIDRQAFTDNIRTLQKELDGKSKICAVMKADAYGNSIDLLMPSILETNVECVGITSNSEAAIVRQHGYKGRIARLRAATTNEILDALPLGVEELFGNLEQAKNISNLMKSRNHTLKYHLALNAGGMDRNGLEMVTPKGKQQAVELSKLPNLKMVGIMTHYAVEDEKYVRDHLKIFLEQTDWLIKTAKLKREDLTLHTANSFTTLAVPEARLDMVRPGGVLYGDSIPSYTQYKKTMAFKTQVAVVNSYLKGSTVGYDQTYTLTRDSRLANLPFGYSDGYRRAFSNKAYVLINGHKVPVVGKVSMNTTMVDVTDFPDIKSGDEVVVYGSQGKEEVKQADLEEYNGALLADLYTVWGNSNQRKLKQQ
ncbi:alanine racemase [Vitreoscilla massiliensis]|uniref:Broad specificity amino-acid racemase n=1 Tax=Vitreoscilla massiliensis TaxID=1689272 RepID=A0ABY4E247_9NEIS|nr:alanine racemase [Vitreoscilla massiliensis]UOO89314.1 alanine racemase [Vitreoscilla massiliensis]